MGDLIVTFLNLLACKKYMESTLALVITTIKLVPNSLVSSANQYLRSQLKVRLFETILLLFDVMEVQILLLSRKKAFHFFYLKVLPSEDADRIMKAIKSVFSIHDLHHLLQKIAFIASDGTSVNRGLEGGIAAKFRKEL